MTHGAPRRHHAEVTDRGATASYGRVSRPVARFAAEILDHYMDYYTSVFGRKCCACHDVLAAAIAVGDVQFPSADVGPAGGKHEPRPGPGGHHL